MRIINTDAMKTYTEAELNEVLRKHENWLYGRDDGCRANLHRANLCRANLCGADLCRANFYGADFHDAELRETNFYRANLCGANLRGADLRGANLCGANLCGANLCGADLCDADLYGAQYNEETGFLALQCPEAGSFIGWKKAGIFIVKLEICEDALRSSATTRKCRCSKAKVLSIEKFDGTTANIEFVRSNYDSNFIYKVGEIIEVKDFDTNRWHECSTGIHFFITRDEAINY